MLELYFVEWLAFGKIEKQRRWRISNVGRRIFTAWRWEFSRDYTENTN